MNWREQLRAYAATAGREIHENPLGVGVEFEDGCDVFWILPGEVTSTLPVPLDGPTSVDDQLAAYQSIGRLRERALHVVRHYIASKNIRVTPHRSGNWRLEWDGGSSSSIAVGAHLTAVARDTGDVYAVVLAAIEHSWVGKVPSRRRIDRYLGTPALPAPVPQQSAPAAPPSTIRKALAWMGVCNALDHADDVHSADQLAARANPTGRIGQTLLRLADRLPTAEAYTHLGKHGSMSIKFDDGYASFEIETRSRPLAGRIAADGPAAVGDQLADEFLALNRARTRTFRAIWQAAAARGWRRDEFRAGILFGSAKPVIHLGGTRREVRFHPGDDLTAALRGSTPEAVLRQLFAQDATFADACVAALHDPLPEIPVPRDVTLAPRDVPPAPPLRDVDAVLAKEIDAFAADTLRAFLAEPRNIWEYRHGDVYDPAIDTWATQADWVRVAEGHIKSEWSHPTAILILLEANDPRGDALARQYLARAGPHHEVSDAEVEIVWRYRHAFPDVARRWFAPAANDDVPFAEVRAKLGDPLAVRYTTIDRTDDESNPAAVERLDDARREQVHREALEWARTSHRWSPPDVSNLHVAVRMGWRDVADALEENPWLVAGLLTRDRRDEQMDEPGMLMGKDLVLAWSRLSPSPFLARLLATTYGTDLLGLAEEAARHAVVINPKAAQGLDTALSVYPHWLKEFKVGLAIAWTRCRRQQPGIVSAGGRRVS
jgi:hypothetical protein